MENDPLDLALRDTLAGSAPAAAHQRSALHFAALSQRLRGRVPAALASSRPAHRRATAWWTGLGLCGTAALAIFLLTLLHSPLRADMEFLGLLATSEKTLFYLKDAAAGKESGWVELKQTFAGYTLAGYDARTDTLLLTKDGTTTMVRLRDARIVNDRQEVTGGVTLQAGEKLMVERATMIFDQENVFPLKNGVVVRITPRRWPDGNILYAAVFERPLPGGGMEKISAPSAIARPGNEFSILIGDPKTPQDNIGFSFKPVPPRAE